MTSEDEQKAIEEDFSQSWDRREEYYNDLIFNEGWDWLKPALELVKELHKREYDRKLLVAKPWHLFVLARSRLRDLRPEQTSLSFKFKRESGMRIRYYEGGSFITDFEVERVEITPEIEALLARLLAQPID